MDILLPTRWRLDALHVLEEGILSRIMEEYFPAKDLSDMNKVYFLESSFPSRSKLSPRSLLEYSRFNGGDKRCVSVYFLSRKYLIFSYFLHFFLLFCNMKQMNIK
jgi:hypothetical protein